MAIIRIGSQREYQRMGQGVQMAQPVGYAPAGAARAEPGLASQVFQAASKLGADWLGLVAKGYRENQTERVDEALLNVDRQFSEWKDEYVKTRQGKLGVDAARDFTAKHEELAKKAVEDFDGENDEIFRGLLQKRLAEQNLHALKAGASYGRQQDEAFKQSQWAGQMASFERLAQERPQDGDAINLEARELLGSWMAKNPGLDPAAMKMKIEDVAQTSRLETLLAQNNPQMAQAVLDQGVFQDARLRRGGTIAEDLRNPLNLKKPGANGRSRDNYQVFASDGDGFRGALNQLKIYKNGRRKLETPAQMIAVWAPPSDGNNYEDYLKTVARVSGLDLNKPIDLDDPDQAARLLKGMATREGPLGGRYSLEQIRAMITENGGRAVHADMAAGDPASGLGALKKARYQNRIDDMLKSQQAAAAHALDLPLRDYLAKCRQGIVTEPPFDSRQILAAYGPEKGAEALRQLEMESRYALHVQALGGATNDEQLLLLEQLKPDGHDDHFAERQAIYDRLARHVAEDQKRRENDPVGYVAALEPQVAAAAGALLEDFSPQAWQAWRGGLNAGLAKRGMDGKDMPALNESMAQKIAEKIGFSDNPAAAMNRLALACGPDFEEAAKLVAPRLGNTALLLAGGMPEDAAHAIMEARKNPDFVKHADAQLFPVNVDKTSFNESLRETLADMTQTFSVSGNESLAESLVENTGIYARKLMLTQGMDADDAIRTAAGKVILDRYETARSPSGSLYRIPKNIPLDPDDVPELADRAIDKLPLDNILARLPGRLKPETGKRVLRYTLKANVTWITAPDESGLVPFLGSQPLLAKNGEPVTVRWADLVTLREKE